MQHLQATLVVSFSSVLVVVPTQVLLLSKGIVVFHPGLTCPPFVTLWRLLDRVLNV
jgi:hypothetical protein